MDSRTVKLTEKNFEAIALRQDGKPVLVDFWASWCGPCRMMEPVLEALANELEGVAIIGKVNVDEEGGLAAVARVQSIPTLVALKGGEVQDVFVGVTSKEALKKRLLSLAKTSSEKKQTAAETNPVLALT